MSSRKPVRVPPPAGRAPHTGLSRRDPIRRGNSTPTPATTETAAVFAVGARDGEARMESRRSGEPPEAFGSLPRALAEKLAVRATTRRYRRGEYICHAGEPAA